MLLNTSGPPEVRQSRSDFTTSCVPSAYSIRRSKQNAGRLRHGARSKFHTAPDWWLYQPLPSRMPTARGARTAMTPGTSISFRAAVVEMATQDL